MQIRIEKKNKEEFQKLCKKYNAKATSVINKYIRECLKEQKIIILKNEKNKNIDSEQIKYSIEISKKTDYEAFSYYCLMNEIEITYVIKNFICYCINNDTIEF